MHRLAESVLHFVRERELLRAGDRLAIAVSGGADSVALLCVMLELRDEIGTVVTVAHLNHGLRGAESEADEEFVRKLAARLGFECHAERHDDGAYANKRRLGSEAAARRVRYEFFQRLIRSGKVNKVATAHTRNDQAETVLLRLTRGSGFRGLGGVRPRLVVSGNQSYGEIIRPFLDARRDAIREYLSAIGQPWREDSSNTELKFARNRVRRILVPLLEKEFNPRIVDRLSDLAEIARAEEGFWEKKCRELRAQLMAESAGEYRLDLRPFGKLQKGVQRRFIQSLEHAGPTLEFRHMEELLALAADGSKAGKLELPCGWIAVRSGGELRIIPPKAGQKPAKNYEYPLPVPGSVTVTEANVAIETSRINGAGAANTTAAADPSLLQGPLVVRPWRAGERFRPQHSKQPKKIKQLLQDRHITGEIKALWPVVARGDDIIWVRGLGVSQDFRSLGGQGISIQDRSLDSTRQTRKQGSPKRSFRDLS